MNSTTNRIKGKHSNLNMKTIFGIQKTGMENYNRHELSETTQFDKFRLALIALVYVWNYEFYTTQKIRTLESEPKKPPSLRSFLSHQAIPTRTFEVSFHSVCSSRINNILSFEIIFSCVLKSTTFTFSPFYF